MENDDYDERAIRQLVATWLEASRVGDTDTVLGLMAEDAVFMRPGAEPMRGQAAFAAAQSAIRGMRIEASSDIQEIKVFGDWAYCWNTLKVTITPADGSTVVRAGDVLSVLQKHAGRWLIVRDANMLAAVAT
jgi:uncharacterized protein (TIGR02246 family)